MTPGDPAGRYTFAMTHARADAFAALLAEEIARAIEAGDRRPVVLALAALQRWRTGLPAFHPVFDEWRAILEAGPPAILSVLRGADERAVRLRQSLPFVGFISQRRRLELLREARAATTLA